jgi:hypothetical protein
MSGCFQQCCGDGAPENLSGWHHGVKQRLRTADAHG